MKEEFLKASDDYLLSLSIYDIDKPKAVIQIAHGMEEHKERYDEFCLFLNKNGFAVVIADMRGHGKNAPLLGFFHEKEGYKRLIQDQLEIRKYISKLYDVPCYLFAHSMGTIISRVFLQEYSSYYDKVVLCGYPNYQKMAPFGLPIAKLISTFKGKKSKSRMLKNLSTGSFNKQIDHPESECSWISYNKENVRLFDEDPLCGFGFTSSAYFDLVKLVCLMHKEKRYHNVNENLKMLLIRGEDDPCVGGKKGEEDSYNTLIKAGFKNIERINYPHMRHEILNEENHQVVFNDVVKFYN